MTSTPMIAALQPQDLPELLGVPLSEEQVAAATAPLAPQLIVAGAGTGKTTVMAARVVWLVVTGQVSADQVLGLTFTNKAAAELRQRIRTALSRVDTPDQGEPGDPTVLTYHAFAGRLITQFGPLLGLEADQRMLSDGQRARLAYRVSCHPLQPDGLTGTPERLAEKIRAMDETLADLDISLAELGEYDTELLRDLAATSGPRSLLTKMSDAAAERRRLAALVAQFREAKLAAEVMDFSDQVRFGSELAHTSELVGQRMREQYTVVLLDEYQDTSRAQRRTLQTLFGGGHPVTAVGDPCQAIYGWRGASVTNIDEFPHQFRRPGGGLAQTMPLTVNRRSEPAILAAANDVATGLRAFHDEVHELRAPSHRSGGRLTCALVATADDEVVWLGDRLGEARERHEWHDMAVLCRSNDQVATVVDHLRAIGIPSHVSSRRDLLALPEVEAVASLLRILVDPYANPEVLHHLIGPRWRIGPRDLSTLARRARELAIAAAGGQVAPDLPISLLDAVHDPGDRHEYSDDARRRLVAFAAELDDLGEARERSLPDLVAAVVDLLAPGIVATDAAQVPRSLTALVDLAQQFRALDGSRTLADFVAYLSDCRRFATSPEDPDESGREGIAVMTMHAAKGLEFPLVALPFLSDGVFPAARGSARWVTSASALPPVAPDEPDPARHLGFPATTFTGKDHDEYVAACRVDDRRDEDRLAYVAITRAETELIASGHWWGPTQKTPRGPSDYLLAIRRACVATGGWVAQWRDEAGERDAAVAAQARVPQQWPQPVARPSVVRLADQVAQHPEVPLTPADPVLAPIADLVGELNAGAGAVELPDVVSASAVLAWLRDPAAYLAAIRRPMPRRPSAAAAHGVAFHSWMEDRVGQQVLFELPDEAAADTDEFAEQLARTAYGERTPHAVEQPFVITAGGLVVTGRIDAVFAVTADPDIDWEVVDWKTGSSVGADPAQLVLYRAAWAALTGCPPERIRATFVFLADGSHVSYDDLVDPDALLTGASA